MRDTYRAAYFHPLSEATKRSTSPEQLAATEMLTMVTMARRPPNSDTMLNDRIGKRIAADAIVTGEYLGGLPSPGSGGAVGCAAGVGPAPGPKPGPAVRAGCVVV